MAKDMDGIFIATTFSPRLTSTTDRGSLVQFSSLEGASTALESQLQLLMQEWNGNTTDIPFNGQSSARFSKWDKVYYPPLMEPPYYGLTAVRKELSYDLTILVHFLLHGITDNPPFWKSV
ncbi:hypothetical protein TNCV_2064151 [Trichonephila clavipes]|nr:hypothetical protein TNCV_2064151 [Trichonephila clavipes]